MARSIVPFKPWQFHWLRKAEPGVMLVGSATLGLMESLGSRTGVVDGDVVFCAGVVPQWPGRYTAWALLSENSGPHMTWITRAVRAGLETVQGRVELTVRVDFPPGQRWAEILGFHVETPLLRKYGPDGEDHIGYVRIS